MWLTIGIVGLVISAAVLFGLVYRGRTFHADNQELRDRRVELARESFLKQVDQRGYNLFWAGELYDEILPYLPSHDPSLSPEDRLYHDIGVDEEDLHDILKDLFKKAQGRTLAKEDSERVNGNADDTCWCLLSIVEQKVYEVEE